MNVISFEIRTPMSSWAVGGSSIIPSMSEPTWSAIVGIIGAALGLERGSEKLYQIASDYAMGISVTRSGIKEIDFNTVQSPESSAANKISPRTRAQELGFDGLDDLREAKIHTSIIQREYVHDGVFVVSIVQLSLAPVVSIDEIITALANPVFPLAAGRRSCVIGRLKAVKVSFDDASGQFTHWDKRIPLDRTPSLIRERRDQVIGNHRYSTRFECVA